MSVQAPTIVLPASTVPNSPTHATPPPSPHGSLHRKPSFISKLKDSVHAATNRTPNPSPKTTPHLVCLPRTPTSESPTEAFPSMNNDLAPSHGDYSPPPTIERRSSFKEVYQSLKSRTLSLGSRSKSNGSDGEPAPPLKANSFAIKYGTLDKQCIGKGATAVVRLVHKSTDRGETYVFAVKEFRKRRRNENEREYIKKLTSEFCISSSLKHINIVRTIDLIQDENLHWCEVMEYCSGGDLYSVIKTGKMSRDEIDCCFKQLIHGVHYLHSNGVAHRDIKPENLLLDNQGHLKITDFGVSEVFKVCWEREPHLSKGVCGSEPYIAPEEFNGAEYDAREVDIWACGIVYYAMVYSGIPWRHATADDPNFAYYLKYRTKDFEAIDRLPRGCRDLMYQILEPSPKLRLTTSDILSNPWFTQIEACFECREYGDVDLPDGVETQMRTHCKHFHHTPPSTVTLPPGTELNKHPNVLPKLVPPTAKPDPIAVPQATYARQRKISSSPPTAMPANAVPLSPILDSIYCTQIDSNDSGISSSSQHPSSAVLVEPPLTPVRPGSPSFNPHFRPLHHQQQQSKRAQNQTPAARHPGSLSRIEAAFRDLLHIH